MNERIKQLAENAEWRFADKVTGNFSEYDKRLEKFAELIVKECDQYVAERFDETEPWMCPGDLLKHFGVKE